MSVAAVPLIGAKLNFARRLTMQKRCEGKAAVAPDGERRRV
jgi:hypothetical protein